MSLHMIAGDVGSGKSFFATRLIIDYLEFGHMVYTNIDLNFEGELAPLALRYRRVMRREEILLLTKGVIILDEGQVWFNSRSWDDMSDEMQFKFQQHRKDDLHVWIITQNAMRLDPVIRELVSLYARPTRILAFNVPWKKVAGKTRLQSVFIPSFGLGINGDPDYAKFRLDVWSSEDLTTGTMRPRLVTNEKGEYVMVPPRVQLKAWLTPKRKLIWNTKQVIEKSYVK